MSKENKERTSSVYIPHANEAAGEADDGKYNTNHAVLRLNVVVATSAASEDCIKDIS